MVLCVKRNAKPKRCALTVCILNSVIAAPNSSRQKYVKKNITVITLAISALISAEEKCEFFIEITVSNFHHIAQMF